MQLDELPMWGFVGKLEKVEAASPDEKELHRCARTHRLALLLVHLWWAAGRTALTGAIVLQLLLYVARSHGLLGKETCMEFAVALK